MKKIYFILFPIMLFSFISNAQDKKGKEKIHALKIAYLTEELDLTSSESEKFWPLYNAHHKKRRALYNYEKKQLKGKTSDDINNLSDKEALEVLTKIFKDKEELHKEKIIFHQKISEILPPKKILIFKIAERKFNKKLMHKLKNKPKE